MLTVNQEINEMEESLYLKGNENKLVDFVLVWEENTSNPQWRENKKKREIFLQNLEGEGLEIEIDRSDGNKLQFVKIHAPMEVLRRYSEILKIRMPIKTLSAEMLGQESAEEADDGLEIKLSELGMNLNDQAGSVIRIPLVSDVTDKLKSWFEKLQEPFYPSKAVSQRGHHQYSAIYSRARDCLFDDNNAKFFSPATRSRILEFLLKRKRFSEDDDDFAFGITRLVSDEVYLAAYPLHDGSIYSEGSQRKLLYDEWASLKQFWKFQPLDAIRDYFGVKIGLYFAWLGFYTCMLIPPSIVGIICVIYGLSTYSSDIPTMDICGGSVATTTMCPSCDELCPFWPLSDACLMTQIKYVFDNSTTVFFAFFMSVWGVVFLEFWKRYSAEITHRWDVFGYDPQEDHPRPEYLAQLKGVEERTINFVTQTSEPKPPFWKMKLPGILMSWSSVLMFIMLAIITVIAIILYRMSMVLALASVEDRNIRGNWSLFNLITAGGINLVLIFIFNYIYEFLATWLTDKELHRTQTGFDEALTLKIYLFQFINYYVSIFYVAFVKGKFVGTPNKYTRFMEFRQEECLPGGCFVELTTQLAILFVGKQFLTNVTEYYWPMVKKMFLLKLAGWRRIEMLEEKSTQQHIMDFKLVEWGLQHASLFYEYLEMVIQYGFITIFVCAFPLAPFFAFCNNVIELRLDAKKIVVLNRRPIAQKVRSIGVWFDIMETLGYISIMTNAFIIALTSEFIPRTVYRTMYSEDGSLNGYVDFTLAEFDTMDMDTQSKVNTSTAFCSYQDYKTNHDDEKKYQHNIEFWKIWYARLLFVVIFENVIVLTIMTIKLAIPDISAKLKYRIKREAFIIKEIIIRAERMKNLRTRRNSAPSLNTGGVGSKDGKGFERNRRDGDNADLRE